MFRPGARRRGAIYELDAGEAEIARPFQGLAQERTADAASAPLCEHADT
jgi:hypothetical protein